MIGIILLIGCSNNEPTPVPESNAENEFAPSPNDVIDEGEQDKIRIVRYTTEGDPIIIDLEYDTEEIAVTNDTTRDQHGEGEIRTTTCESISKSDTENGTEYQLSECESSNEDLDILHVEE